jgi:hypothetical protein
VTVAWFFGDGLDLYAAPADAIIGGTYWDSGALNFSLVAGRFSSSRAGSSGAGAGTWLIKASGQNDGVHKFNIAFQQTQAISGSSTGLYFRLMDGATNQCSFFFRSDGAIVLTSGSQTGTVLATYTGAVAAVNTWYGFEVEVVVHNTAGSFTVRKNGNPSNDFSATSLNTRGGTTNNYVNQLTIGVQSTVNSQVLDDFLWRSDASSVAWVGDIRCYTRMPVSDASVQWSQGGVVAGLTQSTPGSSSLIVSNAVIRLQPYTLNYTGVITAINMVSSATMSGNMKAAIWADNGGVPGAVLFAGASQATVAGGNNVFTLPTPLSVTAGQKIWLGGIDDTTAGTWATANTGTLTGGSAPGSFASFPQANPVFTLGQNSVSSLTYGTFPGNFGFVGEQQQDAATTYVFSSTVGQTDLYGIQSIGVTPASVIGVTTRALAQKTDAGTRNIGVQLKSGSTTSNGTSTALGTSFGWVWRNDLVDPATGAAWTPIAVNNLQIGETVTA